MNRSLLIAICDFLVLSLLPLGVFKGEKDQSESLSKNPGQNSFGSSMFASMETLLSIQHEEAEKARENSEILQQDMQNLKTSKDELQSSIDQLSKEKQKLEALMRLEKEELFKQNHELESSLMQEKVAKEKYESKLDQAMQTLTLLSEQIKQKETTLQELEKMSQDTNQELAKKMLSLSEKEKELTRIVVEKSTIEKENEILKEQLKDTENEHLDVMNEKKNIQQKLHSEQEKIDQITRENADLLRHLNRKNEELKSLQENIQSLMNVMHQKESNTSNLEKEVAVLKTKEANLMESLNQIEGERQRLQNEKSTLTESLLEVTKDSVELQKEMQSRQPLPLHEIYQKYLASVVTVHMRARAKHLLGTVSYDESLKCPLLKVDSRLGVVIHFKQTFFDWTFIENDLIQFEIILRDDLGSLEFSKAEILTQSPSLVFLEVPASFLGSATPLTLSHKMTSHNQAALICKNGEQYAQFEIMLRSNASTWSLPESLFSKLFGAVHPRTGDPVLSLDGQFLSLLDEGLQFSLIPDLATSEVFPLQDGFDQELHLQTVRQWKGRLKQAT